MFRTLIGPCVALFLAGCAEEITPLTPAGDATAVDVRFQFSPDQPRLDNFGRPAGMPAGHAGQTPAFDALSIHYLELVPDPLTPYGQGYVLYRGREVDTDGSSGAGFRTAIDWDAARVGGADRTVLELAAEDLPRGATYRYVRASVSYQQYAVEFDLNNVPFVGRVAGQSGTVGSFLGYNTRIGEVALAGRTSRVEAVKPQGFWLFATELRAPYDDFNRTLSGQAPAGATTVVNPLPESPVPPGSCVVTGSLDAPLVVADLGDRGIELTLSFSTDRSFEWRDTNGNGRWDIDADDPTASERVVDMGLRGLIGKIRLTD